MAIYINKVRKSKVAHKMLKTLALHDHEGEVDRMLTTAYKDDHFDFNALILSKFGSIENLKDQASGEDCEAQRYLSYAYEEGIPQDLYKATDLLESARKNGDNSIITALGLATLYDRQGTIPRRCKAFKLYLEAAKFGHVSAELNLADMYRCGVEGVVSMDIEEAFKWSKRAAGEELQEYDAETSSHPSFHVKGNIRNSLIDYKFDALKWLHKYYMSGECPEGEPQAIKALYYLKKAAELGDPEAQKDFGLAYLTGGHPKDLHKAKRWLTKAASSGEQEAKEVLEKLGAEIIDVEPETNPLDALDAVRQYQDIMGRELDKNTHPYFIPDPMIFQERMFTEFPDSPTAQHYLKAFRLVKQGLEIIQESGFSDPTGITLFARGFLYENSIIQSFPQLLKNTIFVNSLLGWVDKILENNPMFFEGLITMFALYPHSMKVNFESCELDIRQTMFLSNVIHLIKKAEPDKPPKEDPYNFEEDYTSWLHELYYLLGSTYIIKKCYKDGAEAFDMALKCCPNFFEAKLALGYCLMNLQYTRHQEGKYAANPTEDLLEMIAIPKNQRIFKGDYLSWTEDHLIQKEKQLFMEYLQEAPECDKKYHLALLYARKGDIKEAVKWKEKGEDSEEKRLPFMEPLNLATKKYLALMDILNPKKTCNNSKCRNKRSGKLTMHCPCREVSYCGRQCKEEDWKEHKNTCSAKKTRA